MRLIVDIETNLSHDTIWVVCTLDVDTGEERTWTEPELFEAYIKDATLLIGHNVIGFDFPLLNKLWKTKIGLKRTFDTLVLSRLLDPSKPGGHSLMAWGRHLGAQKLDYKAVWQWMNNRSVNYEGEEFDQPILSLLEHYCQQDLRVTRDLFLRLSADFESKEFSEESFKLEQRVAHIISQQERNGFKLDQKACGLLLLELNTKLAEIYDLMQAKWPPYMKERISEKTGKRLKPEEVVFNPASRQQIAEKLQSLGWEPKRYTENGSVIVDEKTLMDIRGIPEAGLIAEYLMLQKRIGQVTSWLEAVKGDGRVHGKVITNGAVTGRMTHHSPNMAQIPNSSSPYGHECRAVWTVDDGNVLVGCDASGLELRMLAHYMKDAEYTKAIIEGKSSEGTDIHTKNQKAAGLETRDQAKTFIYAFLYGAGPAKIGSIAGGGERKGRRLMEDFLDKTPSLKRLRDTVGKYAKKGFVPGLDGRKLWVRSEHSALNTLLQGAGAIVMKKALVIFDDTVKARGWDIKYVANVHDEAQIECHPSIAEDVGEAFKKSIKQAGEHFQMRCPLDGEYKIGYNWKETH